MSANMHTNKIDTNNMDTNKVRVLVVDDSALMRKLIPQMLEADQSIQVVGTAMDGTFCLKKIDELRPTVVTLDLQMPGMNGIDTLKEIMRRHPMPVIVVSSHSTEGASITLKALALGAFDFVAKPQDASGHMVETAKELIAKIKAAAVGKIVRPGILPGLAPRPEKISTAKSSPPPSRTVAIGISTGGPQALEFLLPQLPADFPGSILVVQHMPENFTDMFARRLDELCALRVKEARSGDTLQAGRVLVCPGNRHMKVKRLAIGDVVVLNDEERVNGHRPSVDVLFNSAAEEFGSQAIAVLMTGMGDDGAQGLGEVKKAGGMTIAQNEESCVVYGMPKAAVERGYARRVMALDVIAATLQALCGRNEGIGLSSGAGQTARAGR
jgi:two-component system chemotaxis response regulator CheB